MPQVILVVSADPGRQDGLVAAAHCLAGLTGGGRVRVFAVGRPAAGADVPVEALAAGADVVAEVEARGSRADFVVAAQPGPEDARPARDAFRTALFRTERPLLMVPPGGASAGFGRRVAIAWRDDAGTLRALVPAIPLLAGAEDVHLLAGVRAGAATPAVPPVLVEHGVAATLHVLTIDSSPFGETLLGRAHALGADLLVMGAYAHSPLRDLTLGGMTRTILARADLPVLMRH
jgi:nucleotide-binding universal stress UspA family protein